MKYAKHVFDVHLLYGFFYARIRCAFIIRYFFMHVFDVLILLFASDGSG